MLAGVSMGRSGSELWRDWPATKRFSGYVCAQGSDDTTKESNLACATDVVK